jgi:hypothetical protein
MKLIYLLLCVNILFANANNNIVKTSELELFLFKVGFESLLTDVKTTKDNSDINGEDIVDLKSKIEIIMNEIYKNNRVLKIQDSNIPNNNTHNLKELEVLKKEIASLKLQVANLAMVKKLNITTPKVIKIEKKLKKNMIRVKKSNAIIFSKEIFSKKYLIERLKVNTYLNIKFCNSYDWCKLKDNKGFIPKYYLDYD